ncbi:hypothetical protein HYT56_03070 [Candidatus Woesearchaeota archaeon]|nr:hypothetical protein [Candidatus Woesearchaeota archaeon]
MKFEPVYYADKTRPVDFSNPTFSKDFPLTIINPEGYSGIVTLWTKPWDVWDELLERFPRLFQKDSPLVTLTSLYGNGLPQMLANLAYNPQLEYLAITGNDGNAVPSSKYLLNFLEQGVEIGDPLGTIRGTTFPIDLKLKPELFKHLKVEKFKPGDLESVVNFVTREKTYNLRESDRVKIELIQPEFSDYPSDITLHQINEETPIDAWMEIIFRLNRFGKNIQLQKGIRRTLFNLDVHVKNSEVEDREKLRKFNFDLDELNAYRKDMLKGELSEGTTYTYGNRMRKYFGIDALEKVIERFKKDPADRRGFLTLWDVKEDITSSSSSDSSVPCLTDLYFVNLEGKLMLTANFRTHNATSAWMLNFYGLRAIQEYVAKETGIGIGKINVKSRWIGIDPDDAKTNSAIDLVEKNRRKRINVNDPNGYLVIDVRGNKIEADHYSSEGAKLTTYSGETAREIKDQLRQDSAFFSFDHGEWIGYELARAHHKLHGELPEL